MQIGHGMAHVHTHLRVQVQHPGQPEALELSRSARPASTGLVRGSRPSPSRLCGILGPLGSTPGQLMCRDKISTSRSKPQNEQQPNKSATAPAQRVAICSCSTLIYKREWATIERKENQERTTGSKPGTADGAPNSAAAAAGGAEALNIYTCNRVPRCTAALELEEGYHQASASTMTPALAVFSIQSEHTAPSLASSSSSARTIDMPAAQTRRYILP
jgi:hypothetical protein